MSQAAWASSGMLTVSSAAGTWVLPPARALWIPAGTEHAMDADRHTTVWRTQVRLRAALPLLAAGLPVATVARRVGYATPSAFVAVFRKVTGVPPATYFTSRPPSPATERRPEAGGGDVRPTLSPRRPCG